MATAPATKGTACDVPDLYLKNKKKKDLTRFCIVYIPFRMRHICCLCSSCLCSSQGQRCQHLLSWVRAKQHSTGPGRTGTGKGNAGIGKGRAGSKGQNSDKAGKDRAEQSMTKHRRGREEQHRAGQEWAGQGRVRKGHNRTTRTAQIEQKRARYGSQQQ